MTVEKLGSYTILRKLGEGGMGAVYAGVHEAIGRKAAIKMLHANLAADPAILARFFNEARAVNIVTHPSIVAVYDYGQLPDGAAYLVMELLDGETLSARLARGRSLLEGLRFARQIASALAAAHAHGIVHRDLKPDNVMIVADPEAVGGERVKVLDFGIAKLARDVAGDSATATRTGSIMGTPLYMSPEQCSGAASLDGKADVYSLGAVLYHVACGRPPFDGEGVGAILAKQIYEPPVAPRAIDPAIPVGVETAILAMLAKDPAARPTMAEVEQLLGRLIGDSLPGNAVAPAISLASVPTTLGGSAAQVTPPPPRPRRLAWVLAPLFVIGAGIGWMSVTGGGGEASAIAPAAPPVVTAPPSPIPIDAAVAIDAPVVDAAVVEAPPPPPSPPPRVTTRATARRVPPPAPLAAPITAPAQKDPEPDDKFDERLRKQRERASSHSKVEALD